MPTLDSCLGIVILIRNMPYRVVGVMEKQGSAGFFGGPDFDSQVLVPITTFSKIFGGRFRDFNLAVKAPPGADLADFEYELIGEMRKIRKLRPTEDDNFSINKLDTLVGAFNNVMGVVLLVGLLVTGISLFVGGVGVMNIMFVSVTERTREIGLRLAVGASQGDILMQFLVEAVTLCLIGSFFGVAIGVGAGELIAEAVLAIEMGCEMHDITETVHPHPTLSETVAMAAEATLPPRGNRLCYCGVGPMRLSTTCVAPGPTSKRCWSYDPTTRKRVGNCRRSTAKEPN